MSHPNDPGAWDERPAGACPQCGSELFDLLDHGEHVATACHDCDWQETQVEPDPDRERKARIEHQMEREL